MFCKHIVHEGDFRMDLDIRAIVWQSKDSNSILVWTQHETSSNLTVECIHFLSSAMQIILGYLCDTVDFYCCRSQALTKRRWFLSGAGYLFTINIPTCSVCVYMYI